MTRTLVEPRAPLEFFREQLVQALEHQHVSTSAFTEFYLVNLLATCVRASRPGQGAHGFEDVPLALLYGRAVQATRPERVRLLRALGDTALFTAGFFGDSLERRLVDFDYYRTMGCRAYAQLSQDAAAGFGGRVFGELGQRFGQFADVLAEVSERTRVADQQSILKLYERWLRTGSSRAARLLAEQGLAPLPAATEQAH